ncbi:hypothetical protein [Methylobacterium sp. Gmos1]
MTGCGRLARAALGRRVGPAAILARVGTLVSTVGPAVGTTTAILARIGTVVATVGPGVGGGALALIGTRGGAAILRRCRRTAGLLAAGTAGFRTIGSIGTLLAIRAFLTIRPVGAFLAVRAVGTLLAIRAFLAIGPVRTALWRALLGLGPLPLLRLGPLAGRRRALARLLPLGTFALGLGPLLPGLRSLARLRALGRAPLGARAAALAARTSGSAWPTLAASRSAGPALTRSALSWPALGQPDHIVAPRRLARKSLVRKDGLEQQRRQDRAGQQQRAGRAHQGKPLVRRRSLRTS